MNHAGLQTLEYVFRTRWILLFLGIIMALILGYVLLARRERLPELWKSWEKRAERGFPAALGILTGGFFLIASLSKLTQYWTLSLSGQDFWLFEDTLRQMAEGAPFLTRFAPQAPGWVQHGAIHSFLSWYLALPLSWFIGPTATSLLFNPLSLSGAGLFLGVLIRNRHGALAALMGAAAFLASSQVGRILQYETHPESIYPFFVFLWAWAMGLGEPDSERKVRWLPLILAVLGGMGVKEDSFLVFLPLFFLTAVSAGRSQRTVRNAAWMSFALGAAIALFHFHVIQQFKMGSWGPSLFHGAHVAIPSGPGAFQGMSWSSPQEAWSILTVLVDHSGGISGAVQKIFRFLVSRPWLSLLLLAPWVILRARFWLLILPLAAATAILGGMASKLMLYYASPFLGLLWLSVVLYRPYSEKLNQRFSGNAKALAWTWTLLVSLLFGSGAPEFYIPSEKLKQVRAEAQLAVQCLQKQAVPKNSGVVASRFLGLVPRDLVWADRPPLELAQNPLSSGQVRFILASKTISSFEFTTAELEQLESALGASGKWEQRNLRCEPFASSQMDAHDLILWIRKSHE